MRQAWPRLDVNIVVSACNNWDGWINDGGMIT